MGKEKKLGIFSGEFNPEKMRRKEKFNRKKQHALASKKHSKKNYYEKE